MLQVIELQFDQLPDGEELLTILKQEDVRLNIWNTLAVCKLAQAYLRINNALMVFLLKFLRHKETNQIKNSDKWYTNART